MLKILTVAAKQRCTGFFCMDERFFNHLGPFYETTPPISNQEKITERSEILPRPFYKTTPPISNPEKITERSEISSRPFYETTPPISNKEKITERSEILPQVVNNDVHWGPTEVCNVNLFKLNFSDR